MPRILQLSPTVAERIDKRVKKEYLLALEDRGGWQNNLRKWYRRWRGIVPNKNFPWANCSNLHVPITAEHLERLHASIMEALYGDEDITKVEPVEANDAEAAIKVEKFNNWAHRNEIRSYMAVDAAVHDMLKYGTSVLVPQWQTDLRKTRNYYRIGKEDNRPPRAIDGMVQIWGSGGFYRARSAEDGIKATRLVDGRAIDVTCRVVPDEEQSDPREDSWEMEVEEKIVARDWPVLAQPSIEDVIVPASAESIQEARTVFLRVWMYPDEVAAKIETGAYRLTQDDDREQFAKMMEMQFKSADQQDTQLKDYIQVVTKTNESLARNRDKVCVIKVWTREDIDKDGISEEIVRTYLVLPSGRWAPVRTEFLETSWPHGHRPFPEFHYVRESGRWLSMGLPEWGDAIQSAVNTMHNQRVDRDTLISTPFFGYRVGSPAAQMKVSLAPGEGIPYMSTDDIKFPSFNANTANTYVTERDLLAHFERLSGVNDFGFGMTPQRRAAPRTLGGTMLLMQQGDVLARRIVRRNQETGINELIQQVHQLYAAFGSTERTFKVLGEPESRKITREDLRRKYHFYLLPAGEAANKEMVRSMSMVLYQLLVQNPLVMAAPRRLYQATKDVLEAHGKKNVTAVLGPEPEFDREPMAQEVEMRALAQGIPLEVHPADDDQKHIEVIQQYMNNEGDFAILPQFLGTVVDHLRAHERAAKAKQQSGAGVGMGGNVGGGEGAMAQAPQDISTEMIQQALGSVPQSGETMNQSWQRGGGEEWS
ncbi:MAG: hypothetical protein GF355_09630 [Candidatus Eisenbacteria bacterium]|nr:hypothetical protein [Candidatus Eisenbacteria bacterium]